MMEPTFFTQLYETLTLFLLNILCNLLPFGKCLSSNARNFPHEYVCFNATTVGRVEPYQFFFCSFFGGSHFLLADYCLHVLGSLVYFSALLYVSAACLKILLFDDCSASLFSTALFLIIDGG